MKSSIKIYLAALAILTVNSSYAKSEKGEVDARECAANLTTEGSFLSGKTHKTTAFVHAVNQVEAMKRATKKLTIDSWQITNINQEMGIISASQTVSYGNGKTAPLNVSIDAGQDGVKVSIIFSTSGGVSSPIKAIKKQFCDIVDSVGGD